MEFKTRLISEIGKVIGGGTPKTSNDSYYNGDIPWITPKDLSGYDRIHISEGSRSITQEGLENSSARLLPKKTVLMSSRAPIGYLAIAENELSTNQGFKSIICDESQVDPYYLYYYLKANMETIKNLGTGSTFSEISSKVVKNITVMLPSLTIQNKISGILFNIDSKIEMNQDIIVNLEEMSLTLFKHWFIDFEFPDENGNAYKSSGGIIVEKMGRHIPSSWNIVSLLDIMNYEGGTQPASKYFSDYAQEGYIRLIQIRDFDHSNHLTYIPKTENHKRMTEEDIMIARYGAALGRILYGLEGAYNVALVKVIPNEELYKEFLRNYLKTQEFYKGINNSGGRSAQSGFNKSDIKAFKLAIPDNKSILRDFQEISYPIFKSVLQLRKENIKLAELRDTLLHKLMSGELELPEALEV